MKVDVAGRGAGKTTSLLEWIEAQPDPSVFIVVSMNEELSGRVRRLWAERNSPNRAEPRFICRSDDFRFLVGKVVVDNADIWLEGLVGRPIERVTMNGELV